MQTVKISTSQNIDIDYEIAGLGERILARIIDIGLLLILLIALLILNSYIGSSSFLNVVYVLWLALFAFYDLCCEIFMNGQSIGKRLLKIRVINLDGARPTVGQYLLRWLLRIVDFSLSMQLAGLISASVTDKRQRIGDIAANTTLVKTTPRTRIDHIAYIPPAEAYQPVYSEVVDLNDQDIELLHEVLRNYYKSDNFSILEKSATRIKSHLNITAPWGMDDLTFLNTIIKDYNYLTSKMD